MFKIVLVGESLFYKNYGGGQVYIRNYGHCLLDQGLDVTYLSLAYANVSFAVLEREDCDEICALKLLLPFDWLKRLNSEIRSKAVAIELASVLKGIAPLIVHIHGWKEAAVIASKYAGIPSIVTAHHGGIVCPAGALLNVNDAICQVPAGHAHCLKCCAKSVPGWRLWYPLLKAVPLKLRLLAGERLRRLPFVLFLTPLGIISCAIRDKMQAVQEIGLNADRIIAPSAAIAEALVRNGVPEGKVAVVPHGIPLPQRQPLRSDLENGPIRFLYVGRMSHVKGVHVMLEAFAGLPQDKYELHIVGGAVTRPEQRYLSGLKRRFPSVNAVWHGSRPHEEVPQHIAGCDAMVHPAIFLEIFGLTIAEALAVGRPVIATRCGGAEAQIRDGENGFLVPPNDPSALRQAIRAIINDPSCLRAMTAAASEVVSIEQHVKDLERVYEAVVREKSGGKRG